MKAFKLLYLAFLTSVIIEGCASDNKNTDKTAGSPKTQQIVSGDFNGDGKPETVILVKPQLNAGGTGCAGPGGCTAYIKFSDTTIHEIPVKNCIGGKPDNLGDLNGDGKDEIGLLPDWFTSCWHNYLVYTYKSDQWIDAVPPIPTHCNQWEAHIKPIEKDSLNKGYVVIHYSELVNNEITNKSKIISIN